MKMYVKASFSDTTPSWLKSRLTDGKNFYVVNKLKNELLKRGISLDKVRYLPNRHYAESNNVLPIYLIQTDIGPSLYIPGVNDDEATYINNRMRKLGSISKAKLPDMIVDEVYVDLDNPNNVHEKRESYRDPRYKYDRNAKHGKYAGQAYDDWYAEKYNNGWRTPSNRDKSGYEIPNPNDRIAQYYKKFPDRVTKRIDRLYSRMLDVRSELMDLDFNVPKNSGTRYVNEAYRAFGYATESYQELLSYLDEGGRLKDDRYFWDDNFHEFSRQVSRVNEYLDDVIENINRTNEYAR